MLPRRRRRTILDGGTTVFASGIDREPLRELFLLTAKPFLYVFNLDESELGDADLLAELRALVAPAEAVFLDAKIEAELVELPDDEALELLQSIGLERAGLSQLARVGFDTLGLQTYLTAGPEGVAGVDDPQGRHGARGGGRHPHRLPEGLHQGRGHLLRRPRRAPARSPRPAPTARRAWRARTTSCSDGDVVEFRFNV